MTPSRPPASPPATAAPTGIREREVSGRQGHPLLGALSPSRASDFLTCPLLYRYRSIDRLPERPGRAALRGTLVHEVLDRLFALPASSRDVATACGLAPDAFSDLLTSDPDAAFALVEDADWPADHPPEIPATVRDQLLSEADALIRTYFDMEDPTSIDTVEREQLVEAFLSEDLLLRGYVDRMDETDGQLRVVDYKTGRSPAELWEQSAMFQLRFYALVVQRATGRVPQRLQLLYLGNGEVLTYHPDAEDLERFERKLQALWKAITRAADNQDWRPRRSKKCSWCSHQGLCPEFGGTIPPLPADPGPELSLTVEQ
ncbi:MAG: PD-(D/E)XK nuclease family protein [Candidatus Nanopelagicales bacterium]